MPKRQVTKFVYYRIVLLLLLRSIINTQESGVILVEPLQEEDNSVTQIDSPVAGTLNSRLNEVRLTIPYVCARIVDAA